MRRTTKPFQREYKSRKPGKKPTLFDEAMVQGDELPSRDIDADLVALPDRGSDHSYKEALKAANSVFGGAKPSLAVEAEGPPRSVLSDLSYKDPLEERLAAAASIKRGRKPGSENKLKVIPVGPSLEMAGAATEAAASTTAEVAAAKTRTIPHRRQHVGFLKLLETRRATKPGDRWKLKLRRQSNSEPRSRHSK